MRKVDKIIQKLENCLTNGLYEAIETETLELKNQPGNAEDKEYWSIKKTICAFLNTLGGIIVVGIKEDTKNKKYSFTGYDSRFEESMKMLENNAVFSLDGQPINISDHIRFEIRDFLGGRILLIHVERLAHDAKFVFTYNKENKLVAYERKLEGDHPIEKNKIEAQEEYKSEIKNRKELRPVINATLENISVDQLNEYIFWLNKEVIPNRYRVARSIQWNRLNDFTTFLSRFLNTSASRSSTSAMLLKVVFLNPPFSLMWCHRFSTGFSCGE